jgi:hypothetical protein
MPQRLPHSEPAGNPTDSNKPGTALANASGGKNYIETVWGRGYVLRHPPEEAIKISA